VVDSSKAGMRFRNQDLEGMNKEYRYSSMVSYLAISF
jgi:hypothetical protein